MPAKAPDGCSEYVLMLLIYCRLRFMPRVIAERLSINLAQSSMLMY